MIINNKSYNPGEYDYNDLVNALSENECENTLNALGAWFTMFGEKYWNGETYDIDAGRALAPVYQPDGDDFEIVGFEFV